MESYSVDYDYYYNNKDRPQEASSNRKNFHAITFPNVIVFIIQKNNAYPVCIKRQTQTFFFWCIRNPCCFFHEWEGYADCRPMSRASFRIWVKISSLVDLIGGASLTLQSQVVRRIRIAMSFPPRIVVRGGSPISLVSTLLRLRPELLIKLWIR